MSEPHDPIWQRIPREAAEVAAREPTLASFLHSVVTRDPPAAGTRCRSSTSRASTPSSPTGWPTSAGQPITARWRSTSSRAAPRRSRWLLPGARIGKGILFDHATSIVIGETTVIEDDFSMLHEVTLGGTVNAGRDRHTKIRRGVLIGAGAKVLGNVVIGEGAKIGAGSVVLDDVPPHTTVAGVPAKPVGYPAHALPALEMDQVLDGGAKPSSG